jgi:alpha-galactosidase
MRILYYPFIVHIYEKKGVVAMAIQFDPITRIFHLQSKDVSYAISIVKEGYLAHLYWGKKLTSSLSNRLLGSTWRPSFSPTPDAEDQKFSLDTLPQEYPAYGASDFRSPAYQVQLANGSTVSEFVYVSHEVKSGKPALEGLPAVYVEEDEEAVTLEIVVEDTIAGLQLLLTYTVFRDHNAISRSVKLINKSNNPIRVLRILSASVDFGQSNYDLIHLAGAWVRERHISRTVLRPGLQSIESRRGSSSHQHNPFIALCSQDATEDQGEVYGFNLVYSGSFLGLAEVDQFSTTRVSIGINPFDFNWLLEPGESFQSPEAIMVYSHEGLGGMSRTFHKLYRTRLCRGEYRDKARPILINNWEATYFDFDADKLEKIARAGGELGIELFVLDDGWFGKRNNDKSSLGDWFVNSDKLQGGLTHIAERVNKLGLSFGLWFEPEMISPDSELYREHPDWCLHVPNRRRTTARTQLILDFSRNDVQEAIYEQISSILASAPITYVKWDMNRNMTEIGSALLPAERQRETAHRYMLGLYKVLERITSAFPAILFESCSGGGGRYDPGMLYYMPQTWTSDNTDAVERLKIQYGTSLVYPASSMGSHISAVPNHQVERDTPLSTRGHVAMSGNFGYELDLSKMEAADKTLARQQVVEYKNIRMLVQQGEFYRLLNPFDGNETAWQFVAQDLSEAYAVYVRTLAIPNGPLRRLRLKGLDPERAYKLQGSDQVYYGDELMYAGITIPDLKGDFQSITFHFRNSKS